MTQDNEPGATGPGSQDDRRDPIRELQVRLEAALDEVRPKIRRAMEELDAKVDAAMAEVRPRAESAMKEVRPRVDEFVSEVQPRLDTLLERLSRKIEELRKDLNERATRRPEDETTGAPAGELGTGSESPIGTDVPGGDVPPRQEGDGSPGV